MRTLIHRGITGVFAWTTVLQVSPACAATTPREIQQKVQQATVQIIGQNGEGSGAIIGREGKTYTVLTAAHIVENLVDLKIKPHAGLASPANPSTIKVFPGLDLATIQFKSYQSYPALDITNSSEVSVGEPCYSLGYTRDQKLFADGIVVTNSNDEFSRGLSLACSIKTKAGMSGGPMLDRNGQLIGILGMAWVMDEIGDGKSYPLSAGVPSYRFPTLNIANWEKTPQIPRQNNSIPSRPTWAWFVLRGSDKLDQKDYEGAVVELSNAIRLDPENPIAHAIRGSAYMRIGRLKEGIDDTTKAINLIPDNVTAQYNRGNAYRKLGKYSQAISDYNKALVISPRHFQAINNRGITYALLNQHNKAIADFDRVISLSPTHRKAYSSRAFSYHSLGNNTAAIKGFTQAINLYPQDAEAYLGRGNVYAGTRNYKKAILDYTKAIQIKPRFFSALFNRGLSYAYSEKHAEAIVDYDKALSIDPDNARGYLYRAMSHAVTEKTNQTISDLKSAAALASEQQDSKVYREAKHMLKLLMSP